MLRKIQQFFDKLSETEHPVLTEKDKQLAACALMLEVAAIDDNFGEPELNILAEEMQKQFSLDDETRSELIELAHTAQADAASLHQFTSLIHKHCEPQDKFQLLVGMWRIAFADDHLDKYEEHIIRKVAELLYIRHSDFIRAKKLAKI